MRMEDSKIRKKTESSILLQKKIDLMKISNYINFSEKIFFFGIDERTQTENTTVVEFQAMNADGENL